MSTDEFVALLHKLRFFEGYSKEAARLAEARIRKQHDEGINGPGRKYFERFPGFALAGVRYSSKSEGCGGWVPGEFLELIETAFSDHCGQLRFFETFWPEAGDETSWTFCTKRAQKALVRAKVLAGHPDDVWGVDWATA